MTEVLKQSLRHLSAIIVVWTCLATQLLAQVPQEPEPEKNYVPSYLIIIFAVGLGLLLVCRSGKRSTDLRRYQ